MSRFEYTLPSGAEFIVNGPANATQLQADLIFYEQVAAGSLVGYESGQTLTGADTKITKFELSRLDRGTAGVDNVAVLAISQGLPVIAGRPTQELVLAAIQNQPVAPSIPVLTEVSLTNPITQADIVSIKGDDLAPVNIGSLSSYQVQKLLAQIANLVDQPVNQISQDKGIGRYGFTAYALELAGYIKPGTSQKYLQQSPEDFVALMNTPSIWTGRNGINSLDDILDSLETQTFIQTEIMQQGYDSLLADGTISNVPRSAVTPAFGTVYTNGGLLATTTGAVNNLLRSNLGSLASGAFNNLVSGNLQNTINFSSIAAGLKNQVSGDVGALIVNASKFGSAATSAWAKSGNITNIANLAGIGIDKTVATLGSLNVGALTGQLPTLSPLSLDKLNANLNVFGKASQFATNFSVPTLSLPNLSNLSLPSLPNLPSINSLFASGGDLVSGTRVAAAFSNTVNRKTVDAAVTRILGSSKIPTPQFELPSVNSLANKLDIAQAQNILSNLRGQAQSAIGQAQSLIQSARGQAQSLAQSAVNRVI